MKTAVIFPARGWRRVYPPEERYDVINGDYIAQIRAHGEPNA